MADRTSAGIFAMVFEDLAKGKVTKAKKERANTFWEAAKQYDFSWYQMDCDDALIKLGLARYGVDPDYPEEETILYKE